MARLSLDECVPLSLAPLLTQHGHDVVTAMQLGLRGRNDPFHFKQATEQQRVLVTTNQSDFRLLHRFGSPCNLGMSCPLLIMESYPLQSGS